MGPGWDVDPLFDLRADLGSDAQTPPELQGYYAVTGRIARDSDDRRRAQAFEMSRSLMARRARRSTRPALRRHVPASRTVRPRQPGRGLLGGDEKPLPGTEDPLWALKNLHVLQSWDRSPERGQGVVVAQPDTGLPRTPSSTGWTPPGPTCWTTTTTPPTPDEALVVDGQPRARHRHRSVVISREPGVVVGSAPKATLVPAFQPQRGPGVRRRRCPRR